jgi:hypothetical protein
LSSFRRFREFPDALFAQKSSNEQKIDLPVLAAPARWLKIAKVDSRTGNDNGLGFSNQPPRDEKVTIVAVVKEHTPGPPQCYPIQPGHDRPKTRTAKEACAEAGDRVDYRNSVPKRCNRAVNVRFRGEW